MSDATNIKVSRDEERWEVEVKAEIPAEALAKYRAEALEHITADAKIDGFRQGKAPELVVLQHYGEQPVLEHAAEHAVKHELPEILAKEAVNIVDTPRVAIEPPVAGQPLRFTARAPLAPNVKLPDYAKLAAKKNSEKIDTEVSEEEHAETLKHLKRERARIGNMEEGKTPQEAAEAAKALADADLPELDEAFVKSLGYESVDKFTDAVKTNIKTEKEMREQEKRRASLLEELVKNSTIKYPAVLKEYELDDMEARMAGDLERMGTTVDAYLASVKKSREELRKEWLPQADERAKVRLVLSEIARAQKVEPDQAKLEHELAAAKKQYPNADGGALHAHISHALRNEAVIAWLESQK